MEVKGITHNSKEVYEGYIFVAIKGTNTDGHQFVEEALRRGAIRVYVEEDVGIEDPRIVKVSDTRKLLGELCHEFYGRPSEKLQVIGVTGTNGKTTTTHILESVFSTAGIKVGLIGTIYYRLGDKVYRYEGRTTPDPVEWHSTLKAMLEDGAQVVCAEISSHALHQKRVWGTRFFTTIFTNLSQDHLDYHGDMENYFSAKLLLFTQYPQEFSVINADDPYGKRIVSVVGKRARTYGKEGDLRITNFETSLEGSRLEVEYEGKRYRFFSHLRGEFQAYNLSAAILTAFLRGIDPQVVEEGVKDVRVPGRFETYRKDGKTVIVDYAHTPDALEKLLRTARGITRGRLLVVFGAGGNRDRTKRPLMGEVAQNWADVIVLTSDNPRWEDPISIIEDIMEGISQKGKVLVEPDREKAIRLAVEMAKEGDVVVIAGKGHEDYQEIKGVRYPFSDSAVVREILHV